MDMAGMVDRTRRLYSLCLQIATLPTAQLQFSSRDAPDHIIGVYRNFTRPHPRYRVFRNKSLGAALIRLRDFSSGSAFIESLRHTGNAGRERRRAIARGYALRTIDRDDHVDAIHDINLSSAERQGRPMSEAYLSKQTAFDKHAHVDHVGLFDRQGRLRAYCDLCRLGNFALFDRVIGYKNPDGAMYYLITQVTCDLIEEGQLQYLMYDTMFGARPGLSDFKRRLGFRPYRVKYTLD